MGRPTIYPWDSWLDGEDKTLSAGKDFPEDKKLASVAIQIRRRAVDEGAAVSVAIKGRSLRLLFGDAERAAARGRRSRYPWDVLLDGQLHAYLFSELDCEPQSFRSHAYAMGRSRDKAVKVTVDARRQMLGIQAVGPYRPRRRPVASYSPDGAGDQDIITMDNEGIHVTPRASRPPTIGAVECDLAIPSFDDFDPDKVDWVSEERPA